MVAVAMLMIWLCSRRCGSKKAKRHISILFAIAAILYILVAIGFATSILAYVNHQKTDSNTIDDSPGFGNGISGSGSGGISSPGNANGSITLPNGSGNEDVGSADFDIPSVATLPDPDDLPRPTMQDNETLQMKCVEIGGQLFTIGVLFLVSVCLFVVTCVFMLCYVCKEDG